MATYTATVVASTEFMFDEGAFNIALGIPIALKLNNGTPTLGRLTEAKVTGSGVGVRLTFETESIATLDA